MVKCLIMLKVVKQSDVKVSSMQATIPRHIRVYKKNLLKQWSRSNRPKIDLIFCRSEMVNSNTVNLITH